MSSDTGCAEHNQQGCPCEDLAVQRPLFPLLLSGCIFLILRTHIENRALQAENERKRPDKP